MREQVRLGGGTDLAERLRVVANLSLAGLRPANQTHAPCHPIEAPAAREIAVHAGQPRDDPRRTQQHVSVRLQLEFTLCPPAAERLAAPLAVGALDTGREVVVVLVDLVDEQMLALADVPDPRQHGILIRRQATQFMAAFRPRRHVPSECFRDEGVAEGDLGHGAYAREIVQGQPTETGSHVRRQCGVGRGERILDLVPAVIRAGFRYRPVVVVEPHDPPGIGRLGAKSQRLAVGGGDGTRHGHIDGGPGSGDYPNGAPRLSCLEVLADDIRHVVALGSEHFVVSEYGFVDIAIQARIRGIENGDSHIEEQFLRNRCRRARLPRPGTNRGIQATRQDAHSQH